MTDKNKELPSCAIKGYFKPQNGEPFGSMCGSSGIGGRTCHYKHKCEHKVFKNELKEQNK